jgi:preprotein translocase subunit YajC
MNTTFFYGLMLAVSNIVLTLVFFFLGYQTDKMSQGRWIVSLLPLVVTIVVMWLGIKAAREEAKDSSLSYGKGVGTGVLIALYAGLIGAVYTFIHFTFINPNFADYAIDMARQQWIAAGMSDNQMEQAEKFLHLIYKPGVLAVMSAILSPLFGLVVALILAAFLKRQPAAVAEVTPPVT